MRNLLALVALLAIVVAAVGYYRGWYSVAQSTNSNGNTSVNIEVDKKKIQEDLKTGRDEVGKAVQGKD